MEITQRFTFWATNEVWPAGYLVQTDSNVDALENTLSQQKQKFAGQMLVTTGDQNERGSPDPGMLKKRRVLLAGPGTPQPPELRRALIA